MDEADEKKMRSRMIKNDHSNSVEDEVAEPTIDVDHGETVRSRKKKQTPYEYLAAIDPATWTRSHMSERSRCDVLVNNLSESFSALILEARDKPIVTMLEWIRRKLMNRLQVKRNVIQKYEGTYCPNILKKLEKNKLASRNCFPSWSGELKYEVDCFDKQAVEVDCLDKQAFVDLVAKTCTCRMWQLSGIPCKYAISFIQYNREQPEDYLHSCYHRDYVIKAYEDMIYHVPGKDEWETVEGDKIQAPKTKKQIGRPRKVRKRAADEPRPGQSSTKAKEVDPTIVRRKHKYVLCKKCLQKNHNVRTCKNDYHPKSILVKIKKHDECTSEAATSNPPTTNKSPSNIHDTLRTMTARKSIKRKQSSKSSSQPSEVSKNPATQSKTSVSHPFANIWDEPLPIQTPKRRIQVPSQESFWTNAGKMSPAKKSNTWKPPGQGGSTLGILRLVTKTTTSKPIAVAAAIATMKPIAAATAIATTKPVAKKALRNQVTAKGAPKNAPPPKGQGYYKKHRGPLNFAK